MINSETIALLQERIFILHKGGHPFYILPYIIEGGLVCVVGVPFPTYNIINL